MEEIANRIAALERIFNLKAGMEYKDDTLPDRFSNESILVGGEEQLISKKAIEKMRNEYYQVREWDSHGRPSKDLLKALNLDVGEI
jgi:aldehyde:ferredoxin oxidoreductase